MKKDLKVLISKREIMGNFAKWSIEQSPYPFPENLEEALHLLNILLIPYFKSGDAFQKMTFTEIFQMVKTCIEKIPEVQGWNERKNGDKSPLQFVSRFSGEVDPDDDFIDLDALARNIVNQVIFDQYESISIYQRKLLSSKENSAISS